MVPAPVVSQREIGADQEVRAPLAGNEDKGIEREHLFVRWVDLTAEQRDLYKNVKTRFQQLSLNTVVMETRKRPSKSWLRTDQMRVIYAFEPYAKKNRSQN